MIRVAFIHGFMGSAFNWGRIRNLLEDRVQPAGSIATLAVDLLGHAQNHPDAAERARGHDALVDRLERDLEPFGPTHVVAHSFGLRPALLLGVRRPDLVPHLLVEDSSPELNQRSFSFLMGVLNAPIPFATRDAARDFFDGRYGKQSTYSRFFMSNIRTRPDGLADWRFDRAFLEKLMEESIKAPLWNEWSSYKGNATLIYGEQSEGMKPELIQKMRELRPGLEVHVVKNSGHWIHADQPIEFVNLLQRIVKN